MERYDENLEKIRSYARTTILEKETEDDTEIEMNHISSTFQMATPVQEKTFVNPIKTQSIVAQSINPLQKMEQEKLNEIKEKIKQEQLKKLEQEQKGTVIEEIQQEDEEVVQNLFSSSLEITEASDENLQEELDSITETKPKNNKFRFKLLTCALCVIVSILSGWIIGNIVEISKTTTEITTATEYSVNLKDLIFEMSKLDKDETPSSPSDGSLLPLEEIIPITPEPLDDTTTYEEESNWFDKICNWIRNLFGG